MAVKLPNYDITGVDFIWQDKTLDRKILFYKNSVKIKDIKKQTTEIRRKRTEVPLWEKATLTLEEAAEFSGIGIHKIRELTDAKNCKFILWNGNRRLIKRKKFEEFIDESFSI